MTGYRYMVRTREGSADRPTQRVRFRTDDARLAWRVIDQFEKKGVRALLVETRAK